MFFSGSCRINFGVLTKRFSPDSFTRLHLNVETDHPTGLGPPGCKPTTAARCPPLPDNPPPRRETERRKIPLGNQEDRVWLPPVHPRPSCVTGGDWRGRQDREGGGGFCRRVSLTSVHGSLYTRRMLRQLVRPRRFQQVMVYSLPFYHYEIINVHTVPKNMDKYM